MAARCPRVAPRETSAAKPPDPTHTPRQHLRRRASLCMRASLRQLHQAARAYSSLSASRGVSNLATTFARLRRGPMQRSVFDEPAVVATFAEAGVNPKHAGTVRKLALARLRANAGEAPSAPPARPPLLPRRIVSTRASLLNALAVSLPGRRPPLTTQLPCRRSTTCKRTSKPPAGAASACRSQRGAPCGTPALSS